ncbi:MAG: DUF1499 domain-containing protein [Pseudomonadales bacterium]|nr:DUF1499 domain-containing protein [Pseudomonadales bacterium]
MSSSTEHTSQQTSADTKKFRMISQVLAYLALVVGVGIGLLALSAALGVWFGLWDFRQGFSFLGTANSYGDLVALGGLLIALAVFIVGRRYALPGNARLSVLALVGTLAAGLAYYVPETYRPAETANIPPIHDITTDTVNPPQFVDILPLRGPGTNTVVYGTGPGMTPEQQAQLQQEAYPDIQPQYFDAPPQAVFEQALAAVEALGWELVAQVPEEGRIEATDTTFWFRFKDDIVILIDETAEGSVLNARSVSRVGRSDVGKNAARLRGLFARLQAQ